MDISKGIENLKNNLVVFEEKLADAQERFMESNIGKILNNALDTSLKIALPDVAEDVVISAKDALLENGIKDGVKQILKIMESLFLA